MSDSLFALFAFLGLFLTGVASCCAIALFGHRAWKRFLGWKHRPRATPPPPAPGEPDKVKTTAMRSVIRAGLSFGFSLGCLAVVMQLENLSVKHSVAGGRLESALDHLTVVFAGGYKGGAAIAVHALLVDRLSYRFFTFRELMTNVPEPGREDIFTPFVSPYAQGAAILGYWLSIYAFVIGFMGLSAS